MKKIVSLFLLIACSFSLFSCSLQIEDEKTEWQISFVLGAIDANGNSVSSKSSLRTSEAIPCDGIKLVPDLWFSMEYRFFFYDENGGFVGYTPAMSGTSDARIPSDAVYAHIVMTPFDKNGSPFYSIDPLYVVDYAEKVTVKIDRKQRYNPNLCEIAKKNMYRGANLGSLTAAQQIVQYSYYKDTQFAISNKGELIIGPIAGKDLFVINCKGVSSLFADSKNATEKLLGYFVFLSDSFESLGINSMYSNSVYEVPPGASYIVFETEVDMDLSVYEYR